MDDADFDDATVTPPVVPAPSDDKIIAPPTPKGSPVGAITYKEWWFAYLGQRLLWIAGLLWAGVIEGASYLKENWTIMQGYVPWWLMVAVMAGVGTLLAINGLISGARKVKETRNTDTRVS